MCVEGVLHEVLKICCVEGVLYGYMRGAGARWLWEWGEGGTFESGSAGGA